MVILVKCISIFVLFQMNAMSLQTLYTDRNENVMYCYTVSAVAYKG